MKFGRWIGGVLLVLGVLTGFCAGVEPAFAQEHQHGAAVKGAYYCPMHPDYTSDRPGTCPICGMDLVKRKTEDIPSGSRTEPGVVISADKQQLIGVKKAPVRKRPLVRTINTVGKVAYDSELQVAQEAYIQAVRAAASDGQEAGSNFRQQNQDYLRTLENKLYLAGLSREEIEALRTRGTPQEGLYLPSPSGTSWIYLTVYASEMREVKPGQGVEIFSDAFSGETLAGKVAGVTPVLDPLTRSARVRVEVKDTAGVLRPEMFVNARLKIDLGEQLAVPVEAVMDSGLRRTVFVVQDDKFIPRQVRLGAQADDHYPVLEGLSEGEDVVVSGNFLIDAESRLKGVLL